MAGLGGDGALESWAIPHFRAVASVWPQRCLWTYPPEAAVVSIYQLAYTMGLPIYYGWFCKPSGS